MLKSFKIEQNLIDLIIGKKLINEPVLVTIVERVSRFSTARELPFIFSNQIVQQHLLQLA